MLRVKIELVPYGNEEEAHTIATMLIANDASGDYKHGNYGYAYDYSDRPDDPVVGLVRRFPRNTGAWMLVKKILNDKYNSTGNELTDILVDRLESYKEIE